MKVYNVYNLVEKNGKTIRENNMEKEHVFSLGEVVEADVTIYSTEQETEVNLTGRCRLYVVALTRDCDGTPLYSLSDLPVVYEKPSNDQLFVYLSRYKLFATVCEHGFNGDSLQSTGVVKELHSDLESFYKTFEF